VELKAGEAFLFDYFSSTQNSNTGADILYVLVDGKDIYQIMGLSTDWASCCPWVATEDGTYDVSFVYLKDIGDFAGDDTVYLKNFRVEKAEDVKVATYIPREAATHPNQYKDDYLNYVTVVYNEADGYYHVGEKDGPILLAKLIGYSNFSSKFSLTEKLIDEGTFIFNGSDHYQSLMDYCSYATNSNLYQYCSVTEELAEYLKEFVKKYSAAATHENTWLQLCAYYDSYGKDAEGKPVAEFEDPIKGLASFSADDAKLSVKGDGEYPNILNYDRLIMPRGLFKKFTPTESGVYMITSNSNAPVNGWIFTAEGLDDVVGDDTRPIWHEYKLCDRELAGNPDVVSMKVYLEAGVDYYIGVAFYDLYQEGTLQFRIEKLGNAGNGYQLTLASPGPFTYVESASGEINKIIAGGVDVAFDSDSGYWVEKRTDGQKPSYMYADFTKSTGIFEKGNAGQSITDLINSGAFNFTAADGDFNGKSPNANDLEIMAIIRQHDGSTKEADKYLKNLWGADYERKADEYKLSEIYNGIYHGEGKDFTDEMRGYINKVIKVGDTLPDGTVIAEGDVRIGTVLVDARLGELLQLLMDKEVFNGVETSWRKLCYYDHTFCAETPF
jgi:hypothetical protein